MREMHVDAYVRQNLLILCLPKAIISARPTYPEARYHQHYYIPESVTVVSLACSAEIGHRRGKINQSVHNATRRVKTMFLFNILNRKMLHIRQIMRIFRVAKIEAEEPSRPLCLF